VDFHLKGLASMGATISLSGGVYNARTSGLHGSAIHLDSPSPGATQHLMASATLAKGTTVISNAAMEPEITTLAQFLNAMGARVEGAGTSKITIHGVDSLHGCDFRVPADRLQAGTYMVAAAMTGGDINVTGIAPEEQTALTKKLQEAGAEVDEAPDSIRVSAPERLQGIRVKTMPYPGFPTDMQQPMAALLATARGTSVIEETIYESRIGHIQELNRMGASIHLEGRSAVIDGVERLHGAVVEASDLRAGAALCVAGLAARGETLVRNVHFIDRGYEKFEETISALGGSMKRVELQEAETQRVGEPAP
jgi:UDP-N-acetylglucosamine 1-carboxyvinyltransferase